MDAKRGEKVTNKVKEALSLDLHHAVDSGEAPFVESSWSSSASNLPTTPVPLGITGLLGGTA
ncbi:hypothetical protein PI124_g11498 [Phytophthora idaei]|nr:hypothetical protein PI124_g11498 [Phytophthora idaei]